VFVPAGSSSTPPHVKNGSSPQSHDSTEVEHSMRASSNGMFDNRWSLSFIANHHVDHFLLDHSRVTPCQTITGPPVSSCSQANSPGNKPPLNFELFKHQFFFSSFGNSENNVLTCEYSLLVDLLQEHGVMFDSRSISQLLLSTIFFVS
jgi:hypothetical protein